MPDLMWSSGASEPPRTMQTAGGGLRGSFQLSSIGFQLAAQQGSGAGELEAGSWKLRTANSGSKWKLHVNSGREPQIQRIRSGPELPRPPPCRCCRPPPFPLPFPLFPFPLPPPLLPFPPRSHCCFRFVSVPLPGAPAEPLPPAGSLLAWIAAARIAGARAGLPWIIRRLGRGDCSVDFLIGGADVAADPAKGDQRSD